MCKKKADYHFILFLFYFFRLKLWPGHFCAIHSYGIWFKNLLAHRDPISFMDIWPQCLIAQQVRNSFERVGHISLEEETQSSLVSLSFILWIKKNSSLLRGHWPQTCIAPLTAFCWPCLFYHCTARYELWTNEESN